MSAEAGPGPSSMASSPVVPGSAKKLRIKRRVINLVNPADPEEFSGQSTSPNTSPNASISITTSLDVLQISGATPSDTPAQTPTPPLRPFTPLGMSDKGVRGILRPVGTPGSGNGVRFFPKNRFRIITPNHSLHQSQLPQPTATPTVPPPVSPRRSSFLGQLLAATMPSISPRKEPEAPPPVQPDESTQASPNKMDESWEVPGQEGEVSLVASSAASAEASFNQSQSFEEEEQELIKEDSWNGQPTIHSSPLTLPEAGAQTESSREISFQELPSAELQIPSDMSNLLNEQFSPQDPSFSITMPMPRSAIPQRMPRPTRGLTPIMDESEEIDGTGTATDSITATVRATSSPNHSFQSATSAPGTPTPTARPIDSILADMSAEQANMSWPLKRNFSSAEEEGAENDTAFHSAMFAQFEDNSTLADLPALGYNQPASHTPMSEQRGDKTQFFDITVSNFAFSPLSPLSVTGSTAMVTHTPTPITRLVQPTRNLFEAQTAHTSALLAEIKLYRDLAEKLHAEVVERDGVLAELNGKALEAEVLRTQVDDLRDELAKVTTETSSNSMDTSSRRKSVSPSPSPSPLAAKSVGTLHAGDRTTVMQAENRDLEIRLARALADHAVLAKELAESEDARQGHLAEVEKLKLAIKEGEEKARDQAISARSSTDLQIQLAAANSRVEELQSQLSRAEADNADSKRQIAEMREVKLADEEEITKLHSSVEGHRGAKRREEDLKSRLNEIERTLEVEQRRKEELEGIVKQDREVRKRLEAENRELARSLHTARLELAQPPPGPDPATQAELNRLRAQSASKDLEIVNLQRRKEQLKEDKEMLNIALDSKQQELELIKRKFAVKGVAGSTPLGASTKQNETTGNSLATPAHGVGGSLRVRGSAIGASRRQSSMSFVTPSFVPGDKRLSRTSLLVTGTGSTALRSRVLRSAAMEAVQNQNEENEPPAETREKEYGSLRRQRVLA